jgi:hypothetical protein
MSASMIRTMLLAPFYVIPVIFSILGIGLIIGFPVMWLWNYEMPYLFGFKQIDFWHAWAMVVLSGVLFKATNK